MSAQLVTPSGVELTGSAAPRATAGGARVDAAGEVKVDVTQLSAKDPRTQVCDYARMFVCVCCERWPAHAPGAVYARGCAACVNAPVDTRHVSPARWHTTPTYS